MRVGVSRFYATFFTRDHQWVDFNEGATRAKVGITNFAQESLGDIIYADMPKIGANFEKGEVAMNLESVKAVGEVYMPVDGTITEVNSMLDTTPGIVNKSPQQDGWIFELKSPDVLKRTDDMLTQEEYTEYVTRT